MIFTFQCKHHVNRLQIPRIQLHHFLLLAQRGRSASSSTMRRLFIILAASAAASAWSLLKHDPHANRHVDHSKKHFEELDDLQNDGHVEERQASVSGSASTSTPGEFDVNTLTTTSASTVAVAAQTGYPGSYYQGVSPDGTCGANVGYSCLGSAWGNCCRYVNVVDSNPGELHYAVLSNLH